MTKTALLIVDMQNDLAHPDGKGFIPDAAHRAPVIGMLLDAFREAHQPVIHVVRSYRLDSWDVERFRVPYFQAGRGFVVEGSWGARIIDRLAPEEGEPLIVKQRFSAFAFTELDLLLRRAGVTRIVVTGVNLPNCPRTTMFDAIGLDYDVIAPTDALAAANEDTRQANISDLAAVGVRIATAAEVASEIRRIGEREGDTAMEREPS
ncbi:MAG: cysteine hydrolase family protein [Actinomycetota bacterium]|nr:cysteine hydrolase [Actinomycetota bacterium]